MSAFDSFRKTAFDAVSVVFGDVATWTPSSGGDAQTAKVLFGNPTENDGFGYQGQHVKGLPEFETDKPFIEYLKGSFIGLKESADQKTKEIISVNGNDYRVSKVVAKFDGTTLVATLSQIS